MNRNFLFAVMACWMIIFLLFVWTITHLDSL